ncbi:MAG: trypsin-like peptidase domain-containing protein [Gemmatimonadota bacterium]
MTEPDHHGKTSGTLDSASRPVAVFVHLSGDRRGTTERLSGDLITIGTAPWAHVVLPPDPGPGPEPIHATLHCRGLTYELVATANADVWVNGQLVDTLVLASGDLLEFGKDGPILRYRLHPPGSPAHKSLGEAFSDSVDFARHGSRSALGAAATVARGVTWQLATQTSRWFRGLVAVALVALLGATAYLARQNLLLERRLDQELARVDGLAELVEGNDRATLGVEDLAALQRAVEARIETLEARSGDTRSLVETAMASTLFLQGSYAFREKESGRMLRRVVAADGNPVRGLFGPALTLEGDGAVFEVFYTGTGFIADVEEALVVTNRHVAVPWEFDENARGILDRGFEGVMQRFVAYLPGAAAPIPVAHLASSEEADVAVVRVAGLPADARALPFADTLPSPGDEVLVVGYPLGLRALVARTDPAFMETLVEEADTTFWSVALRLAEEGHMAPLVSRGIVSQVTSRAVVYDAETTNGGSGGPVLSTGGRVVAVNAAVLPDFGGGNMGVPADRGAGLLRSVRVAEAPGGG